MRVHFLGVCGTFMAGLALIAQQQGFDVIGSDEQCYPPMSTVLAGAGIDVIEGYDCATAVDADIVVVGNVISRGNPALESCLRRGLRVCSGPAWLAEHVLCDRHVLAVSGTHGKTTTSALLAWLLDQAGLAPSFLIGGAPNNFPTPVRLTDSRYFVIEADEYDSAFFDKRPKFMHYFPDTLIMNNLEFDHADIFDNVDQIIQQFGYQLRTVSPGGTVIFPAADENLTTLVNDSDWVTAEPVGCANGWHARALSADASQFELRYQGQCMGEVSWSLIGEYNLANAVSACAAAHAVGVGPDAMLAGLRSFSGVKKRLEKKVAHRGITVYEDFAHHPTAVGGVVQAMRAKVGQARLIVLLECGSRTMQRQPDLAALTAALAPADHVMLLQTAELTWDTTKLTQALGERFRLAHSVDEMVAYWAPRLGADDHVMVLSNKHFDGLTDKLGIAIAT